MFDPGIPFVNPREVNEAEYDILHEMSFLDLWSLNNAADAARAEADERFPDQGGEDGHNDAFRHAYWNALMVLKFGEEFAESLATAHETGERNPADREAMDLYNNSIGRRIARENPNASEEALANLIYDAINNGEFLVIDNNGDLAWSDDVTPGDTGRADDDPMDTENQTPPPALLPTCTQSNGGPVT